MNNKSAKKLRQMHQREMRRAAMAQSKVMRDIFKPKPRFVPMWLWLGFMKIFIKM